MVTKTIQFHKSILTALLLGVSLLASANVNLVFGDSSGDVALTAKGRTIAQQLEDRSTTLNVRNSSLDEPELSGSHINVTTVNGVVLLTGEVGSAEAKQIVESRATQLDNVRQVVNELRVSQSLRAKDMLHDQWIKSRVKLQLGRVEDFPASKVIVVVSNDVVYLMGVVSQTVGKIAAEVARRVQGVDRVISVFETS